MDSLVFLQLMLRSRRSLGRGSRIPPTPVFFLSWGALGCLFLCFFRSWALLGRHRRSKSRLGAIFGDLESIFGGFGRVWGGFWEGFGRI